MTSTALENLENSLLDVNEIIKGHVALTGGGKGRPVARQGQAITRSGVVLLCAAVEQYFEDLFKEAAPLIYPTATMAFIPYRQVETLGDSIPCPHNRDTGAV